jgi:hypothetical protein
VSYVLIFLVLVTKWFAGCALVVGMDLNFWQSVLIAWSGGMTGVAIYTYLGHWMGGLWRRQDSRSRLKTRISRLRRIVVLIRQRQGLLGIAIFTPVLLTVPIGTFSALVIEPRKSRVMLYMGIAFAFWSVTFCALDARFGIDWVESLKSLFD